jgi:hypothetical protein
MLEASDLVNQLTVGFSNSSASLNALHRLDLLAPDSSEDWIF